MRTEDWKDIDNVAEAIGLPITEWPGKCHQIACAMNEVYKIGLTRYGHYAGPIHPDSIFGGRRWSRHGWIQPHATDALVVDPTRWCFTMEEPEIYYGLAVDYDAGGNWIRPVRPMPEGDGDIDLRLSLACRVDLELPPLLTVEQVLWLANLPMTQWAPYEREVVESLVASGNGAFVPIDNRRIALGQDSLGRIA